MQTQTIRENSGTIGESLVRNLQENASTLLGTLIQKIKKIDYDGIYARNAMAVRNAIAKIKVYISNLTKSSNGENPNNKKFFLLLGIIGFVVVVLGGLILVSSGQKSALGVSDSRPSATSAKKTKILNKVFQFPIRDEKGKEVSKFTYEITSAELYDTIIVKGQRANAVKGRTFFILNLKLINKNSTSMDVNTRDYIRLSVNGASELTAPDIHNDPVQVQAISTKYTRVGVAINDTDKNIVLHVGEITGKKEDIKIDF